MYRINLLFLIGVFVFVISENLTLKRDDDGVLTFNERQSNETGASLVPQVEPNKEKIRYNETPNSFLVFLRHHGSEQKLDNVLRDRRNSQCNIFEMYRSFDGSCNNLIYPDWGKSNTPFSRILPPRYSDGIHRLPISVTGGELPNPRTLSSKLFSRGNNTEPFFTLAVMQWGQTVAHDITFTTADETDEGSIKCCTPDGNPLPEEEQHYSCAPIIIPSTDKFYAPFGQRCMNFVRSMTAAKGNWMDWIPKPADQLNAATSFLDLAPLYGNNKNDSDSLREFEGGRLKTETRNGRHMMPILKEKSEFCDIPTPSDFCFKTGDSRTNQNPQLIVLHTLLLREHNRIANALSSVNPNWNDETIFQESRRILIAMYQHITYNEWLPIIIGDEYSNFRGLDIPEDGMSRNYDFTTNPATINCFASSALRFLHSIIEGQLKLFTPSFDVSHTLRLSDHFARPQVVEPDNNFEDLLRGLIHQPIQRPDFCFNEEITEHLFQSGGQFGMDLEAIDIQRGRDHGLPGYNAFRIFCGLKPAKKFDDLINEISWDNIKKLEETYAHVDDVDFFVGASMENRISESLLGPTFRCIFGEQFHRIRVGDRFFYDNADFFHSFTPEQFREIKKASFSRLICDSCDSFSQVQKCAFRVQSQESPLIPCENLPKINFHQWEEH